MNCHGQEQKGDQLRGCGLEHGLSNGADDK